MDTSSPVANGRCGVGSNLTRTPNKRPVLVRGSCSYKPKTILQKPQEPHRICYTGPCNNEKHPAHFLVPFVHALKICQSHHTLSAACPVLYSAPRSPTSAIASIVSAVGPGHLSRIYAATISCPLVTPPISTEYQYHARWQSPNCLFQGKAGK